MATPIIISIDINGNPMEVPLTADQEYELLGQLINKYFPTKEETLAQTQIHDEPIAHQYKYQPKTKKELKQLCEDESIYLGDIDTSLITDMSELFAHVKRQDFSGIETWDVSNVTSMFRMFNGAEYFNQDISQWDVSNVTDMSWMFSGAKSFNQPIDNWDVSNVTDMQKMFYGAKAFNQPIGSWDTSNVTNMFCMLDGASTFNQPIGSWDMSKVTDMSFMFTGAESFNQDVSAWELNPKVNKTKMFKACPIYEKFKPVKQKEKVAVR